MMSRKIPKEEYRLHLLEMGFDEEKANKIIKNLEEKYTWR